MMHADRINKQIAKEYSKHNVQHVSQTIDRQLKQVGSGVEYLTVILNFFQNQMINYEYSGQPGLDKIGQNSIISNINFNEIQYNIKSLSVKIMESFQSRPTCFKSSHNDCGLNVHQKQLDCMTSARRYFKQCLKHIANQRDSFNDQFYILQQSTFDQKIDQLYVCPICQKTFAKSCALGGHMARMHKNKEQKYLMVAQQKEITQYQSESTKTHCKPVKKIAKLKRILKKRKIQKN